MINLGYLKNEIISIRLFIVIENLSFSITVLFFKKTLVICNTKKMIEKVIVKKGVYFIFV